MRKQLFLLIVSISFSFSQDYINDTLAVRAILDSNGFFNISVDSISDSSNGRIDTLELIGAGDYANIPSKLSILPSEIGKLTKLKYLDLWHNNLEKLPSEIGELTNLKYFIISDNLLDSLPVEIGNLSNLEEFYLDYNKLTSLPLEIGKLTNLIVLSIGWNKLIDLPTETGNLTNLLGLWINSNNLRDLPIGIGNLVNLVDLYLQYNKLAILPESIINLTPTFCLDVRSNCLDTNNLSTSVIAWLDKYAGIGWIITQDLSIINTLVPIFNYKDYFIFIDFQNSLLRYFLPFSGYVRLDVLDSEGRVISTLVESYKQSGVYSENFDMDKYSCGIYYFRITARSKSIVRKVFLIY